MNEEELDFCPKCGTKTLEAEIRFVTKTHCANCGTFFTIFIDPTSTPKKGFLLRLPEESNDPNHGLSQLQIAKRNPGMKDHKK